jgi:hypothetical protein
MIKVNILARIGMGGWGQIFRTVAERVEIRLKLRQRSICSTPSIQPEQDSQVFINREPMRSACSAIFSAVSRVTWSRIVFIAFHPLELRILS